MLLERFYDEDLSHASYFIGCQASGEAIVIDPRRDIHVYTELAQRRGMKIVAVTETHIHADYLSGTRELQNAGATAYVSKEGGADWTYGFDAELIGHGDTITIGNLTLEARHTPGHTPEHLMFLLTDGAFSDEPGYAFTGDFVFAGDLGRPDLLDEAAGGKDTRFGGAQDQFDSLACEFVTLPDYVQVYPAHGAGSPCGKALGAVPSSTVGYEKHNAWWAPFVKNGDREGFVNQLLDGQPDAHAYFARMKTENRDGPAVIGEVKDLVEYTSAELAPLVETAEVVVVDPRHHSAVHAGAVSGSLNIPGPDKAASFGAWAYDPQKDSTPLVILASGLDEARDMRDHLVRVGIDTVVGYVTDMDGLPEYVPTVIPFEDVTEDDYLLDVRGRGEFDSGHIPGARNINGGRVLWRTQDLPQDARIVSYCQSGVRNSVAASALRRAGFEVAELEGSYQKWANDRALDGQ